MALVCQRFRRYKILAELLQRGRQMYGGGKISDFRQKSPFTSKTVYETSPPQFRTVLRTLLDGRHSKSMGNGNFGECNTI